MCAEKMLLDMSNQMGNIKQGDVVSPMGCSAAAEAAKAEKESIHSGQFMVSHFEAEEAQDDLDDSELKMLDPEDPTLSKSDEPSACMEVQLYVPRKVVQIQKGETFNAGLITSHLEIETSLTKLFKCMNLAYSQKLTSPKWNHFKGVRLRWKDKIRLNNVIWRCWHMQFILKRRTPVCQFASPLDVDIHSNPQSVVLEGKYWKRQLTVIQAEYRKWRRHFKTTTTGCLTYDTKSEFDFLEWSPLNERSLMLSEDWTSDTLFSAINGPFPFPDPREIARGAGIADFIQPSLGPLQPNLDDIDLTFADLLQNARLPPVPEEGSDEMLKNADYGFSAIMGSDQMDSSNIMEVATNNIEQLQSTDDTNMVELNTPLNTMQFSDIEQQFVSRGVVSVGMISNVPVNSNVSNDAVMTEQCNDSIITGPNRSPTKHFGNSNENSSLRQNLNDFSGKSVIKGRISKNFQRPFRREPHNYDKAQPTLHQTTIYQQMLAEQQKQQNQQQHLQTHNMQQLQPSMFQQQLQLQQIQYPQHQQYTSSPIMNSNSYSTSSNPTGIGTNNSVNNIFSLPTINSNLKNFGFSESMSNSAASNHLPNQSLLLNVKIEPPSADVLSMFNLKSEQSSGGTLAYKPYSNNQPLKKSASTGAYLNIRTTSANQLYMQNQTQAQSTHSSQPLPFSLGSPQQIAQPALSTTSSQQLQQPRTQQQVVVPKEIFRSNSLPLNVSLNKIENRQNHDNFAVPKYHAKSGKSRSRSNSINQHMSATSSNLLGNTLQASQQLQTATSDPMLNSTLAQLLTTNPRITLGKQQQSSSMSVLNVPMTGSIVSAAQKSVTKANVFISPVYTSSSPSVVNVVSSNQQQLQHQQHQTPQQNSKSPKKSASLPVPSAPMMLHSPPGNKMLSYPPSCGSINCSTNLSLSPESFHDQDSPLSPAHSLKCPRDNQRRAGHIHAEQKRRYNIKNGFDMLHSLIPQLQQSSNAKLSKAAMLQKGAEHIKQLRSDRNVLKDKMDALSKERDALTNSLSHLHSILPANGAPLTRQGTEQVRQLYEQYVRFRSLSNWKFWILGLILEPLLSSYTTSVSSASMEEMRRTAFLWIDQHCSLVDLRPAASNKLKYLSMKTDILSDPPSTLQEEVKKALNNTTGQHPNLHGS